MKKTSSRFVALTGLLSAAALTLAFVESLIPWGGLLPPGVKPGLSNIVTMFAAFAVSLPAALAVTLFKALFALLTRGAVAGLLSLTGGVLSASAVWLLFRLDRQQRFGFFGISVLGAICHNLGQLAAVWLLSPSPAYAWYLPVLLLSALGAGLLTGFLLRTLYPYLNRVKTRWIS